MNITVALLCTAENDGSADLQRGHDYGLQQTVDSVSILCNIYCESLFFSVILVSDLYK